MNKGLVPKLIFGLCVYPLPIIIIMCLCVCVFVWICAANLLVVSLEKRYTIDQFIMVQLMAAALALAMWLGQGAQELWPCKATKGLPMHAPHTYTSCTTRKTKDQDHLPS